MKGRVWLYLGGTLVLVGIILWSGGFLRTGKISPKSQAGAVAGERETPPRQATAEVLEVTDCYQAVGTLRSRTETQVQAQVTVKILAVAVKAGDKVRKGDVLVTLDSRELQARLDQAREAQRSAVAATEQARQGIRAAQAAFDQARAQHKRVKTLFNDGAITSREMDQAEADYLRTEAGLRQAQDGVAGAEAAAKRSGNMVDEAEIALGYAVIKAHEDGEVAQRLADPGDLATPGKTLLVLQAGGSLQMEALVREGLIHEVRPGRELKVDVATQVGPLTGVVEEVAPSADPRTRTFMVKIGLPAVPGMRPGMFGRLLVPMASRQAVAIPAEAVRRVGQLETVLVLEPASSGKADDKKGVWRSVYVTTAPLGGQDNAGKVEVLSGLRGGETVGLPAAGPISSGGGGNV